MLSKRSKTVLLLFFALFMANNAFGQYQQTKLTIVGIDVEGNQFSDPQTIIALTGLRIGEQIVYPSDNKLQLAIKALWNRHQFSDVDIVADKINQMGVFLRIKVREFHRLSSIRFDGNSKMSSEKLKKEVGLFTGDILSPNDIYLAKRKLLKLYAGDGLAHARIEAKTEATDTNYYDRLVMTIAEGSEFYCETLDFVGNTHFTSGKLASAFDDTHTKHWWQFWRSSKFDLNKYKKDKELLIKFYREKGFIDAEILKDTVIYDEEKGECHITVNVREGNPYYIRNITFQGNTVYASDVLKKRLDFKKGDPYDSETFKMNMNGNAEQTDALSAYLDNGYLRSAMMAEETRIQPDSVDINVQVLEGERFTVRKIDIVGNRATKDKVVRRELYTQPGDYFSRSAMIRSVRALGALNFFNPEALKPDVKLLDNNKVDLIYKVEERSTSQVNASVGFAGSFGITGSIGLSFNNFSLTEPFLGGAGQVLNFNWEFGQLSRYQTLSLGFTEPWFMDQPTTLGFNVYNSYIRYNYEMKRTGISVNIGRRFHWPDDYFRGDLTFSAQRNDVGDYTSSIYYRAGITNEYSVGLSISRVSLDNMFFPAHGSRFSVSSQWAMGAAGIGNTDYIKNSARFDMVHPIWSVENNPKLVLYLSTNWGYITGIKSDTTISPIELYYMGGNGLSGFSVTPLRGYDDQTIGPTGGGRVMIRNTAELRFVLAQNPMPIYVYGFGEAGNVWSSMKSSDPFSLKRSAGIGIQLFMNPIGLIGFSYGYGFDPPTGSLTKSGWRFLFHFGNQQ